MRKSKFTESQIVALLQEGEGGRSRTCCGSAVYLVEVPGFSYVVMPESTGGKLLESLV